MSGSFFLSVFFIMAVQSASAHLFPPANATLRVVDDKAYLVVSLFADHLEGVDDNSDGKITRSEVEKHVGRIGGQFRKNFHLGMNGKRVPYSFVRLSAPDKSAGPDDAMSYVVIMAVANLENPDGPVTVSTGFFEKDKVIHQLSIRATRNEKTEVAVLSSTTPSYTFFMPVQNISVK